MIPYVPHKYWPERYRRQGKHYVGRGGRAHVAREQLAAITPLLRELVRGKTVLDFGCGPQRFRAVLEEGGRAYEGVDLIPGLGTMRLADGLPADRFDCIVAVWVLQHIVDEAEYRYWVGQLYQSLAPGGRLVVVDAVPVEGAKPAPHMGPRGMDALLDVAPWDGDGEMVTVRDGSWVGWIEKPAEPTAYMPPVRPASVTVPRQSARPQQTRPQRSRVRVTSAPGAAKRRPPPPPVSLPPATPAIAASLPEVRDPSRAIVIGGGECVWTDVRALEEMLGHEWDGLVIAANDVGCVWPRPLHYWVTLHPEKFKKWMEARAKNGLPPCENTWSRKGRTGTRFQVQPWAGGSSGMLGVTVAREIGCTKIVLCGVPMTRSPHFRESVVHPQGRAWTSADNHWRSWTKPDVLARMRDYVRSMSGRTEQLLGAPTLEWLGAADAAEVKNVEEA